MRRKPLSPSETPGPSTPETAITVVTARPMGLSTELSDAREQAREYVEKSSAENTRRAYESDWKLFCEWCRRHGQRSLPASPETVTLYITMMAKGTAFPNDVKHAKARKASTIERHLAGIRWFHRGAVQESPTSSVLVKTTLHGIMREHGSAKQGKKAATIERVREMVAPLSNDPKGLQERAVLLMGFALACRRSELVALNLRDVEWVSEGFVVTIRRSKTDQLGRGVEKRMPRGSNPETCPVAALERWLATRSRPGAPGDPLFISFGRHAGARLRAAEVSKMVKRGAQRIGLDAKDFGAHSLRAGFVTSAARAGKTIDVIREKTGHKKLDTLAMYIRREGSWDDDAAKGLL